MDELLTALAESSPISVVAIFCIWRMSVIMMTLVNAFVVITTAQSDTVAELVDKS